MKFISSTGGAENFLCQRFDRLCSKHVLPCFSTLHSSPDEDTVGSTCFEHSLSKRWHKKFSAPPVELINFI